MPVIPKPVVILTADFVTKASRFTNVSYWQPTTAPGSAADCTAIANDFMTGLGAVIHLVQPSSTSLVGVTCTYQTTAIFFTGLSNNTPILGTDAGRPIGDEVAVCIRKNTGFLGRRKLGRYFIGGLSENVFDTNNPNEVNTGGILAQWQAIAAFLGADVIAGGFTLHARHWDRKDGQLVPIANCTISSRIATRRDRRRHSPNFGE